MKIYLLISYMICWCTYGMLKQMRRLKTSTFKIGYKIKLNFGVNVLTVAEITAPVVTLEERHFKVLHSETSLLQGDNRPIFRPLRIQLHKEDFVKFTTLDDNTKGNDKVCDDPKMFASKSEATANETEYLGCHKIKTNHAVCKLQNKAEIKQSLVISLVIRTQRVNSQDDELSFSTKIHNASAIAVQWIRRQPTRYETPSLAWVLTSLQLAGYINDGGHCSNTLNKYTRKLDSMTADDVTSLSGGKLALLLLGLKASCKNARNFKKENLLQAMKVRMGAFPKNEFNNYYQYSLGIIALYVHGVNIPSTYGQKLLRGVRLGKKMHQKENFTDTEALAMIALSALDKQTFVAHKVRKHVRGAKKRMARRIERIFKKEKFENLVTVAHLMQVLQIAGVNVRTTSYCTNVYTWLLQQQKQDGSFGNIMATATVLPVLNEYTILDLKEQKCPLEKDDVNRKQIKQWIRQREHQTKKKEDEKEKPIVKAKKILVKVQVYQPLSKSNKMEEVIVKAHIGMTVLDVLHQAKKQNKCFRYKTKPSAWGRYLWKLCQTEINHIKKAYWAYYINEKYAQVGVSSYQVEDNDVITFKYKTP